MKKIHRILAIFLVLCGLSHSLWATHNRAGEITLTQIGEYSYEILITTFTYSLADINTNRKILEVSWGDNTVSSANRESRIQLPNNYQKNTYRAQHTFPGPGTFEIVVQDPNRNKGVLNIPNSVNVIFSIKTTISINPLIGQNSTPILLNPPIDRAALDQVFIHNPGAYDPDGDSISYKLAVCTEADGKPISNYELPSHSDTIYVDPITGDLNWIKPNIVGIYNIAINIEEWRKGVKIGNIVRDMQIEVYETDNHTPQLDTLLDYCLEAGSDIGFRVIANDEDDDLISLSANGGPFITEDNQATFIIDELASRAGHAEGEFLWQTNCSHVRQQPYTVLLKAEDDDNEIQLVDIKNVHIKVVGPAPSAPMLTPSSNSIGLIWNLDTCEYVRGYKIYRRSGPIGYTPDSCITGVPGELGYELVTELQNRLDTVFVDNNKGSGLEQGFEYCYMITSIYPDGAESYPSPEVCTPLIAGLPAMIHTSVTDPSSTGSIELKWIKPKGLDTIPANGPYKYEIRRYDNLYMQGDYDRFIKNTADISDTTFNDTPIDAEKYPYTYQIILYNAEVGNEFLISDTSNTEAASSTYLSIEPRDNKLSLNSKKNVPWINNEYTWYRYNDYKSDFDSIGFSTSNSFIDIGLKNGQEYCYRLRTRGWRIVYDQLFENENWSHIGCGIPEDNTPPCPPFLTGGSNCSEFYNELHWSFYNDSCLEDVESYNLYYSPTEDGTPTLVEDFTGSKQDSTFIDYRLHETLTGCYYITAIDSFANESELSAKLCLDECQNFKLPNVFSPNNDHKNDLYTSFRTAYIEKVDFQVFDRWGIRVFQTEDPDINWDGKIENTNRVVSPGVYYYFCEVFEPRLAGIISYAVTGFIYIYSGKENEVFIE